MFDGAVIADPFRPTAELVAMMRIQAGVRGRRPRVFGPRPAPVAALPASRRAAAERPEACPASRCMPGHTLSVPQPSLASLSRRLGSSGSSDCRRLT